MAIFGSQLYACFFSGLLLFSISLICFLECCHWEFVPFNFCHYHRHHPSHMTTLHKVARGVSGGGFLLLLLLLLAFNHCQHRCHYPIKTILKQPSSKLHGECPEEDFSAIPPVDFNDEDHWAGRRRRQVQPQIFVDPNEKWTKTRQRGEVKAQNATMWP